MSTSPLSAPGSPHDDSLVDAAATASVPESSTSRSPRITPSSPKPRLMFDPLPPPSQGSGSTDGRSASTIMTLDDYKQLNKRTQRDGLISGILGGGAFTYLIRQFAPTRPSKNGLFLSFLLSSTFVSYFTSHTLLVRELGELRARAAQRALPQAPDGGGVILPDTIAIGDKPTESLVETKTPAGGTVMEELKDLGKKKDRTRWAKGQGLVGEVEEEGEMRDTWFRPGVPRREV